ncbi:MAG: 1-acyl-sn-glycerol-3-phosphate acyltransferase [Pseudomonadota bacterium]
MFDTINVPVWLFALLVLVATFATFSWLLIPSARLFLRRRVNRVIDDVNTRLQIELRPFQLTRRQTLIDRLTFDPEIVQAINDEAQSSGSTREALSSRVTRYAREIVPAFNAYLYFRLGYWLARGITHRLYRVRIAQLDDTRFADIDPQATVVFVINHRSNMDYVLLSCLVAERTALSYAVGEWARVWPLQSLVKSMGGFFVRRSSRNPLYRKVLERYVHMASREGVCQAVFLEGGLSKDGLMREPKMGFLGYMLREFDPVRDRDVVMVPVGINYDRTLEDRTLLRGLDDTAERRTALFAVRTTLGFIWRNIRLMLGSRWRRLGYASAAFGSPVSMREYYADNSSLLSDDGKLLDVEPLANQLAASLERLIPVLPVAAVAAALLQSETAVVEESTLLTSAKEHVSLAQDRGAVIGIPQTTQHYSLVTALEMLVIRRIVERDENERYHIPTESRQILAYYANSIAWIHAN